MLAGRRHVKLLASGNLGRQQAAENTMKRMEIGLQKAIVTAKNDFITECAAAYRSHKERDFHGQLITHRVAVKILLQQQAQKVIPTFGQATLRDIRASVKSRHRPIERKATGDDSLFSRLIQQWLGQRKDMASSIAQTTLNDVLGAVQSGIDDGDGTDEIARGIDNVTRLSLPRSRVIARTETHAAASFAQVESARTAETDLGISLVKTWLPTLDNRTREDHAEMASYGAIPLDEKFIVGGEEMDRPGDPAGSAAQTINCLHPDSVIDAASPIRLMRRWFDGELVTVKTANGHKLTITPNHPILTPGGWKAANLLQKGGRVVCADVGKAGVSGNLDVEHVQATVEQMFNALSERGLVMRVDPGVVDFHGEGREEDVDVIDCLGDLLTGGDFSISDPLRKFILPDPDLGAGRLLADSLLLGGQTKEAPRSGSELLIRLGNQFLAFFERRDRHPLIHRFGTVPRFDAEIAQIEMNRRSLLTKLCRNGLDALTRLVEVSNLVPERISLPVGGHATAFSVGTKNDAVLFKNSIDGVEVRAGFGCYLDSRMPIIRIAAHDIVSIKHLKYQGYVYNLEDAKSYYICNGIVQHNCRCTLIMGAAKDN